MSDEPKTTRDRAAVGLGERFEPGKGDAHWMFQASNHLEPNEADLFDTAREIASLQAENERLRDALDGIQWSAGSIGGAETLRGVLDSIQWRAREAIGPPAVLP